MPLTEQEESIRSQALDFARANKKRIAQKLTDPDVFLPEERPVSIFMAGSPGAGKTEASIELIRDVGGALLRIDPDELRSEFVAYTGENSWLFQPAVSVLVERIAYSEPCRPLIPTQAGHRCERCRPPSAGRDTG